MYRHCTFCAADLGENEVVEAFPVGRRLAFDGARGRLWVICRHCERWNLTPLEERWEAVEAAERIFRETPLRVSTEEVGLARHREGLDLVRIGAPLRPEFAAWRYGDQFGRRRKRAVLHAAVGVGVVGGLAAGSAAFVGGAVALNVVPHLLNVGNAIRHAVQPKLRIPLENGGSLDLPPALVGTARVRPGPGVLDGAGEVDPDATWHMGVNLSHGYGYAILSGPAAVRALRAILPRVNASGAGKKAVVDAVRELEDVGGPQAYFSEVELRARAMGKGYMRLPGLPAPLRLALEMAANEDLERVALEGELAWLEAAWRDAEEIAAISDDLTLPERVRIRFGEMKARHGAASRDMEPR
jgi:hypothetical protein